jgi:hypothetical protein
MEKTFVEIISKLCSHQDKLQDRQRHLLQAAAAGLQTDWHNHTIG